MDFIWIFLRDLLLYAARALFWFLISLVLCGLCYTLIQYPIMLPFVVLVSMSIGRCHDAWREVAFCGRRILEIRRVRRQTLGCRSSDLIHHLEVRS